MDDDQQLLLTQKRIACLASTIVFGLIASFVYHLDPSKVWVIIFILSVNFIFCFIIYQTVLLNNGYIFLYYDTQTLNLNRRYLQTYLASNNIVHILKNSMVECRLIISDEFDVCIYCKEKTISGFQGKLIKTNNSLNAALVSTIWGYIQANFNINTTAYCIANTFDRYFDNNLKYCYPKIKNEAQNEYCRMVLNPELSEIKCYEIWRKYPKCFYIKGELKTLNQILFNLQTDKKAFLKYDDLIANYRKCSNIEIIDENEYLQKIDINNANLEEINSLPGINIAVAKKLIKKREEINGFKSVADVLLYAKVKPNVYNILLDKIYVSPIKPSIASTFNTERIIDL